VTDSRYAEQAPAQLDAAGADGVDVRVASALSLAGAEVIGTVGPVGLEADAITWADQRRWAAAVEAEPVPTEGLIRELRSVKDHAELARMRRAAAIVDEALAEVRPRLVSGVTERELALALDDGMRARGAVGPAYETIVASGPNGALPHARPGDRALEPGDLVVIDAGALVDGYRSDMTRTFTVGEAPARAAEIVGIATAAQAAGVAAVAGGVAVGDVDRACRDLITEAGYGDAFGHGTGHGVGLDIHELPAVRAGNTAILQPGQVITVEPGIYLPGFGGVRVEDLVVVTDTGCRPLTQFPKESPCPPSPPTT
jgi:Xaa-Pro aminopeptidase